MKKKAALMAILACVLVANSACGGSTSTTVTASPEAASDSVSQENARKQEMLERAMKLVDEQLPADAPTRRGASPSMTLQRGKWQTISMRDQNNGEVSPGRLTFTFYCSGTGTIFPTLTFDGQLHKVKEIDCVQDRVASSAEIITLEKSASVTEVAITYSDRAELAVGYSVSRD